MLSKGEFQERILKAIQIYDSATFVDLRNEVGDDMDGSKDLIAPNRPNTVLWGHISQGFADALTDLPNRRRIRADIVSLLEYLDTGTILTLPHSHTLQQKDFAQPHWIPLAFSLRKRIDSNVN